MLNTASKIIDWGKKSSFQESGHNSSANDVFRAKTNVLISRNRYNFHSLYLLFCDNCATITY